MVVNIDKSLIPNTTISVPSIDRDVFIEGLMEYIKLTDENEFGETYAEIQDALTFDDDIHSNLGVYTVFGEMFRDNVEVDLENFECTMAASFGPTSILGIRTTSTGVVFFGCVMGGDWETPLFQLIYFDGKEFKSYLPKYGNAINLDIDSAFGNDEEADEDYLARLGFAANVDVEMDESLIMEEIETVFRLNGNTCNKVPSPPSNFTNTSTRTSTSTPTSRPVSVAGGLITVLEQRNWSIIGALQQNLLRKGYTTYDKSKCFQNLTRDEMLKDIYNYILQLDLNVPETDKQIELNKILVFLRKYQKKFD